MHKDFFMMWLTRIEKLTRSKIFLLFKCYEHPQQIWDATENELASLRGIGEEIAKLICSNKDKARLRDQIIELEELDIKYISIYNEKYPEDLKAIDNPPFGFYYKGIIPDNDILKVSIVGARKCSEYGKYSSKKIAKELSYCNIAVVSGLAEGIDTYAHKGALEGNAPTIAVLGGGINKCFPSFNKDLLEEISENGCVISEYPPNTTPKPAYFPQRNRIIAALSKIVIVIEAGERSGSLITANMALDFGKDIFALPGNVDNILSSGTNALIKDGAYIITTLENVDDILLDLKIKFTDNNKEEYFKNEKITVANDEKKVYDCIHLEPISFDELFAKLDMELKDVQYILTMLEMQGLIKKINGNRYVTN